MWNLFFDFLDWLFHALGEPRTYRERVRQAYHKAGGTQPGRPVPEEGDTAESVARRRRALEDLWFHLTQ